jgi:hypothetical protein
MYRVKAPAGGAAAAAREGCALAGPSAPTSNSTRWALVMKMKMIYNMYRYRVVRPLS